MQQPLKLVVTLKQGSLSPPCFLIHQLNPNPIGTIVMYAPLMLMGGQFEPANPENPDSDNNRPTCTPPN